LLILYVQAHALVSTSLDEIAWIFNLRGSDVPCNPVSVSYSVVTKGMFVRTCARSLYSISMFFTRIILIYFRLLFSTHFFISYSYKHTIPLFSLSHTHTHTHTHTHSFNFSLTLCLSFTHTNLSILPLLRLGHSICGRL
jgi:Creatinase/Prolidase N-terminal domain